MCYMQSTDASDVVVTSVCAGERAVGAGEGGPWFRSAS